MERGRREVGVRRHGKALQRAIAGRYGGNQHLRIGALRRGEDPRRPKVKVTTIKEAMERYLAGNVQVGHGGGFG